MKIPAISVIIPMYNSEEYIGECLESLLAQTFQDFEVIVVDDCSTDASPFIVESYLEKFDGRLKINKTKRNSGGGSAPRNKGTKLSRGEYLFFMDSDDFFIQNALESMYKPAKEADADVIYCERYYSYDGKQETLHEGLLAKDTATLELNKQLEHLNLYASDNFFWSPWTKFVKRDWVIKNGIFFQELPRSQDFLWTLKIFTYAERFLRIPTPVYFYRFSLKSTTRNNRSNIDKMCFWISPVIKGLKEISDFMKGVEFLKQNPQLRYEILDFFVRVHFSREFLELSWQFPPHIIYEMLNQKFGKNLENKDVLISYFCAYSNKLLKIVSQAQHRISVLENEINRLEKKE